MRYALTITAIMLVGVSLAGIACQKAPEQEEPGAIVESEVWVLPDSMISEQVWLYFTDKPEEYFEKTVNDLDNENQVVAARDLKTAAAYLKVESARAHGKTRKAIQASIEQLEKTADQTEDGIVTQTPDLERMFAGAHLALAEHQFRMASAYLGKDDEVRAGEAMDVAATNVEHGLDWLFHHQYHVRTPEMKAIFETAGQMAEGKPMKPGAMMDAMLALEKQVADFRAKFEAAQTT
jgi:hypothetical protein